jgi:NADPH:quinone reductase-like Zn-dependent oxidoreductase
MKAIVCTKYGPPSVLELRELAKPIPKDNEVLIRVHAATVTTGDCETRSFTFSMMFWLPLRVMLGFFKPRKLILGQELAGEIEAVGNKVTRFKKGDNVFAATLLRFGAYAEYICLPETYPILHKPESLTFEEAATIPTGGINGLHFIKKANIQSGQKVLINGAGGSIGTYAIQIAKDIGAQLTCVDSTEKLDMLRSIGADRVVDYTQQDFTKSGETYDVIIDVIGKSNYSRCIRMLNPGGRYVIGTFTFLGLIRGIWTSMTSGKKVLSEMANYRIEDLSILNELIVAGKIKPIIDKHYPLEGIVEAHTYVEEGHKKGNVVIRVTAFIDLNDIMIVVTGDAMST